MSGDLLRKALERTEASFLGGRMAEAALARREARVARPGDEQLLTARAGELRAAQATNGSWDDDVLVTASALLELAELESVLASVSGGASPEPEAAVQAGLGWLRALRDSPGRFAEACAEGTHRQGLCCHAMTGFHGLPPGSLAADPDSLVVASARATRAALQWGERSAVMDGHLESLRRIISHWAWPGGAPALQPRSGVAALAAVLEAPREPADVASAAEGIACLVRTQRADGTWHGVSLYEALDTLLLGVARGYSVPEVDGALARAAELLAISQKANGGWGRQAGMRQPLTAWRVLRYARALETAPAAGSAT